MKRAVWGFVLVVCVAAAAVAQHGSAPTGYERYESDELMLALYHPDGWFVVEDDGNFGLVNREALITEMSAAEPDLRPGDVIMAVGVLPTFFLGMIGVPIDSVEAMIDGMFTSMLDDNDGVTENERRVMEYRGAEIGMISFFDANEEISGLFFLTHMQDEVVVFAMAAGMMPDLDAERDTLARIVSTVEFTGTIEELMGSM